MCSTTHGPDHDGRNQDQEQKEETDTQKNTWGLKPPQVVSLSLLKLGNLYRAQCCSHEERANLEMAINFGQLILLRHLVKYV